MTASWAAEMWGSCQHGQKQTYDEKAEAIVMESVCVFSNGTGQIVVRNVGTIDVAVGAVYVDGVLKYSAPSPQGVVIRVGDTASFTLFGISSTAHFLEVATLRGNSASGHWVPVAVTTTAGTTTSTSSSGTTGATTSTTGTTTTVTTTTYTTTYTTLIASTTVYTTTSRFTTTYTTTQITTSTRSCDCHDTTTVITKTSTVTSSGTTTVTSSRTTTITTAVTTTVTTTTNLP